jgi:1-acyl-sn-glycerol-3-phosphate acyltransferase
MSLERLAVEHDAPMTAGHRVMPALWEIVSSPLPALGALDRMLVRGMAIAGLGRIFSLSGLEHIAPARDPFILALNHSTRQEALLVPPLLFFLRGGQRIHFLADWNFRLIPPVDLLYRRAGAITVARKPARPRVLNRLKPLFANTVPPLEQARAHLAAGRSVGIFPEGTVNSNRARLLHGRFGAARLSLETGVPVVPVGIRFPQTPKDAPTPQGPMDIAIGAPLMPSADTRPVSHTSVRDRHAQIHAQIMSAISQLSGKSWDFSSDISNGGDDQ